VQNKLDKANLLYEGSVKKVWRADRNQDRLWFEYTDDYSVFDWGKMPDTIANKGRSLAIMGAFFFEKLGDAKFWQNLPQSPHVKSIDRKWLDARFASPVYKELLCKQGCPSHYQGLVTQDGKTISLKQAPQVAETVYLSVLPAEVTRPQPKQILNQNVYHYNLQEPAAKLRLVPLEVVFRFGMPEGSSLKGRLEKNPDYARVLGLSEQPKEGHLFSHPVVELFTKLEDKDRLLSVQEALLISGLPAEKFNELVEVSYDLALALFVIFAEGGIQLWDGKFEFAQDKDKLLLVDSIGPDELRLIYKKVHLSKEMIRQVYRGSSWEKALKEAQKIAAYEGRTDWKEICRTQLKEEPKQLPASFKAIVDKLYSVLVNHLTGTKIFADQPSLDEFVQSIETVAVGAQ
jgi:phosphoribosylaminoimidazole-succinocarboxamide synthase